ncbi:EF-hand domain-containing protein [Alkalimarinus sediminis]|uniref:EF-hand domain-containing protein n=1 Tax=Alkalimarinus sediminis TaxID=1632866 RepID=A0A9E8HPS5_9ALTE|nr:EF-hand domain-containing protein [Alkalimarinus sediminis]UZW74291.1 EF-hand domain-containing protein [Alkalimarinus sediminis]
MAIRTILTVPAAAALLLALSTNAGAESSTKDAMPNSSKIQEEFSVLDKDGNGKLTQEEVNISPELASAFVELDANSNGDIDMSEYVLYHSPATAAGKPKAPSKVEATPAN